MLSEEYGQISGQFLSHAHAFPKLIEHSDSKNWKITISNKLHFLKLDYVSVSKSSIHGHLLKIKEVKVHMPVHATTNWIKMNTSGAKNMFTPIWNVECVLQSHGMLKSKCGNLTKWKMLFYPQKVHVCERKRFLSWPLKMTACSLSS